MDCCTMEMLQPITMKAPPGPVPDGMKVSAMRSATDLGAAGTCPAVGVGSFTLWPMSYRDNRVGFGMVMYDPRGRVVGVLEKPGARYVYKITRDGTGTDGTLTVWGQSDHTVTLSPAEVDRLLKGG
jgi:hypothetical protein